jgi:L-ascorbate metabolism protein UlaG (beta-lactamase superfamily)
MQKLSKLVVSAIFLAAFFHGPVSAWGQAKDIETLALERAHHSNPGFRNPWLSGEQAGRTMRLIEWKLSPNPYRKEKKTKPYFPVTRPDVAAILNGGDSVTYLGHATFWIRVNGQNIITDPVFGDIVWVIDRYAPFPLPPSELAPMQVVLISHDHYDHLDRDSIRKLGTGPLYLTPPGYREWIEDILPGAKVIELDWFQKYTFRGVTYRMLPVQHWTKRTPFDTNRRLWGSWLVESANRKIYFAGDSGYFPGFAEYGRKFGPMDAALLPIGAYEPRWFMSVYHMDPAEAVLAFKELRAKVFIPQQWGVFDLTDEPMDLPPKDYRKAARQAGLTEEQAPLLPHGGTHYFEQ